MRKTRKKGKSSVGVCPECKVREGDSSRKRLFKCNYCGRRFCKKHLRPRLATPRSFIEKIKDPVLKDKVYEEWRRPNGHPDWVWTRKYFEELELKKEEERRKFLEILDKLKGKKITEMPERMPTKVKSSFKPTEVSTPLIEANTEKIKRLLNKVLWELKLTPYNFLRNVLILLTILTLLHFFFVGKFGLLPLILRSIGLVFLGYFISLLYNKTKHIIPYKWLCITIVVVTSAHIFSTNDYSMLRIIDKLVGIEDFTDIVITKISRPIISEIVQKPNAIIDIGKSLFRYKTSEEILVEKIEEFRNNSTLLEKRIHELINQERKKHDLSSLKWDEDLAEIARYHSKDMAIKGYFAHESPVGEDLEMRYKRFNYFCRISVGNLIYFGAENILLTHVYDSYYYDPLTGEVTEYIFNSIEEIAYETVDGWMSSEGHRENILTSFFRREGIGVYVDDDGEIYITQNFC